MVGDDAPEQARGGPGWSSALVDELRRLLFMNSSSRAL